MDEAVGVNHALVARVQEAVRVERFGRRLCVVQVAHDDLGPTRQDLAGLVLAGLPAVVGDDLDVGARDDGADGLGVPVVVEARGVRGDAAARLGHAVALLEARVREASLQQLQDLLGQRGRARGEALDAGEVVVVDARVAHEADEDGRHEQQLLDLVRHHGGEHGRHSEGGQHDDLGVDEDRQVQPVHEAGDVEERQYREHLFVRRRRDLLHLQALPDDVLMRDHDGFGEAGRAGAGVRARHRVSGG